MPTTITEFLRASAIAAMHAMWRRVQIFFPTATHDMYSREVIVTGSAMPGYLDDQFSVYFPMKFRADVWHNGIVPVILNLDLGPNNSLVRSYVENKNWEPYIGLLAAEIEMVLGQKGYIPWDEPEPVPENPAAGIGEPVSRVVPLPPTYRKHDCDC